MKKIVAAIILLIPLGIIGVFWLAGNSLTVPVPVSVGNCPPDLACENVEFPIIL